jgi:uncharacterized Zn-binding protein involved in type VI secretion
MTPIACVGQGVVCICGCKWCKPCPSGRIITGSSNVFVGNSPAATVGSITTNCCGCCCRCPNTIKTGNNTVLVNNKPIANLKSSVSCGFIRPGSRNVLA